MTQQPADFSAYSRARTERTDAALISMFAEVLNMPLAMRELSPEQQTTRDSRTAVFRRLRAERRSRLNHGHAGGTTRR